jgi:hypothetical protein
MEVTQMNSRISDHIVLFSTCAIMGAIAVGSVACTNGSESNIGPDTVTRTLALAFEGLEALGDDYVYEGWVIVDGAPVSTGVFEVDENGVSTPNEFVLPADIADAASLFVLTIEPAVDDDPAPSHVHVLGGTFQDDAADLTIDHEAALGTDLLDAVGSFILKTPTTHDVDDDDVNGIWWLELTDDGPAPSLVLPALPQGWVYEGWVVGDDGPISTGRFGTANEEDSDGAGMTAGPDGFPMFAGQDFIAPPTDLIGHAAVISVEPEPDNSPAPFTLKPLVTPSIMDAGGGVLQTMENHAMNHTITGSAWFKASE